MTQNFCNLHETLVNKYITLIDIINFSTVSVGDFIFHMNIPCGRIFLLVLNLLSLTVDLFFKIILHTFV